MTASVNVKRERDALRHDVISFEVEPLTSVHSFGDVLEPDGLLSRKRG